MRSDGPISVASAHRHPRPVELIVHSVQLSAASLAADPTLRQMELSAKLGAAKDAPLEQSPSKHTVQPSEIK